MQKLHSTACRHDRRCTDFTGEENFQGVLVLPHGWGKRGSVSYRYVDNGEQIDVGPVAAEPITAENVA